MDESVTVVRHRETPAPRPRRASLLWLIGAVLLAYSVAIAVTGGIDVVLLGLRIRSRTWQRPALLAIACLATVAIADRRRASVLARRARAAAARMWVTSIHAISPRAVAATATLWTLGVGLVFRTCIAGGADSSGYLSQARLLSHGRSVDDRRLPASWPDGIGTLAPLGFRPTPDGRQLAPIYPPGYPLLMAPAFLIHERAPFLVVPLCGALTVWLTFGMGRRLREPAAGAAAALLVSASPTFLYQLVQPMSDVPATAAWLLALYLACAASVRNATCAGVATGVAILIRPNLAPLALLVWCACALGEGGAGRWRRVLASITATMPAVVVLGMMQSRRYGSALASGYGSVHDLFGLANVWPNLDRYPRWMVETHTPLIFLFLAAPLWLAWRRQELRVLLMLLWTFAVAVVLAYLPYVYFQSWEWSYTRFLLPALPMMWLLTRDPGARFDAERTPGSGRARPAARPVVCSGIFFVGRESAFRIRSARWRAEIPVGRRLRTRASARERRHLQHAAQRQPLVLHSAADCAVGQRRAPPVGQSARLASGQRVYAGDRRRPRRDRSDQGTLRSVGSTCARARQACRAIRRCGDLHVRMNGYGRESPQDQNRQIVCESRIPCVGFDALHHTTAEVGGRF